MERLEGGIAIVFFEGLKDFQYQPGDKVRVKIRSYTGKSMTTYTGLIEFVHERFITVHNGKYRVTVSTADLHCGDASIELNCRCFGRCEVY